MNDNQFEVGRRYPMTMSEANSIMVRGWPALRGEPDTSRGRLFLGRPCKWAFWLMDGRKVDFEYSNFGEDAGFFASQSKEPDPDRPEPLHHE